MIYPVNRPEQAEPTSSISTLLGNSQRSKWAQRLATAHASYLMGRAAWKWAQSRLNEHRYTVSVHDRDDIYGPVQAWVLERMPPGEQRALIVRTGRRDGPLAPESPARQSRAVEMHFDGDRSQQVTIDGHRVLVHIQRDTPGGSSQEEDSLSRSWRPAKIVFSARTVEARDAVLAFLARIAQDLEHNRLTPRLFTASRWGEWVRAGDMRPRPLDSVVLRAGQLERIVEDLHGFYAAEGRYVELGLPWHRGYVFHGPPGTGKTSTAKAIAAALNLDLFYVPLSDVRTDADLGRMLSAIEPRSMLLLEDVDVVHAARERDDQGSGITASGLLNALDGVITPHGLVTTMTTNRLDALDPAFLRPGRADRLEEMSYLDADQFKRLCKRLTGQTVDAPFARSDMTAAEVVEVVKRHLDDPRSARSELAAMQTRRQFAA